MRKVKTFPWDVLDHLNTEKDIVAYLEAALAEGDSKLLVTVMSDVVRAIDNLQVAEELSPLAGDDSSQSPDFKTVIASLERLGLQFSVAPRSAI